MVVFSYVLHDVQDVNTNRHSAEATNDTAVSNIAQYLNRTNNGYSTIGKGSAVISIGNQNFVSCI
jgi:hypothetical protein